MSGPDLFVVCKNCQAEVSPYITECPYCGTRLRKRAPKIERADAPPKPLKREQRALVRPRRADKPGPKRLRVRRGEIAVLRGDDDRRPWATIALIFLSFGLWLSLAFVVRGDLALTALGGDPWRYVTAALVNDGSAAQLAVVAGLGIFGWLLERRYGPVVVVALFVLCGPGALAAAVALDTDAFVFGTHGAALGMLCAWLVPVLIERRRHRGDDDADLLGVLVIAAVLVLVPFVSQGSAAAGLFGAVAGALLGVVLAQLRTR